MGIGQKREGSLQREHFCPGLFVLDDHYSLGHSCLCGIKLKFLHVCGFVLWQQHNSPRKRSGTSAEALATVQCLIDSIDPAHLGIYAGDLCLGSIPVLYEGH